MATTTVSFAYTGADQTWVVPSGVSQIIVDVRGGKGGNPASGSGIGGNGGRVQATIPVTPGETLTIEAGCLGSTLSVTGARGYPAAGRTRNGSTGAGASAGGRSAIRRSSTYLAIAGGGGGASNLQNGADGGGLIGADAGAVNTDGKGGSQVAGGVGGTSAGSTPASTDGIALQGGDGGAGSTAYGGGGGGDGFYGGGGGGGTRGGGGGSSYTDASVTAVTHTQGYNAAAGAVSITYTPSDQQILL